MNQATLDAKNEDLGAGGPILLPPSAGDADHPNLLIGAGKEGKIYLIDANNMGHYNPTTDQVVQETSAGFIGGSFGTPAYFNGTFYYGGIGDYLKAFTVANAAFSTVPVSQSPNKIGFTGTTPSVSAEGNLNGIVWALDNSAFGSKAPAVLYAYDASNLSNVLYTSAQAAGGRDQAGAAVKFTVPTVINGKVYVGGGSSLTIYGLLPVIPAASVQVNLASSFNHVGIVTDGSTFSSTGGLDRYGSALSGNLLGTSQTWLGSTFAIGPANVKDVVVANGQTITLPAGQDVTLDLLATGVNQNQPNQTFTVTYTDGTKATFVQSISDWNTPQGYLRESQAIKMAYRDKSNGTKDTRIYYVYGYMLPLDSSKTVSSITLPKNVNVNMLAADLIPAVSTTQVNLSSSFNQTGIYTDGSTFSSTGGLDGAGTALSANLLGASQVWAGSNFAIGPAGANDVVSATGQTIALPFGQDVALNLLATAVGSGQPSLTFTVTYTDGTTATFNQSISNWSSPQNYPGESQAVVMAYADLADGTASVQSYFIYGYSFTLDSTRVVASITLPNQPNVNILAMDLQT